jgi:hypothetical protein
MYHVTNTTFGLPASTLERVGVEILTAVDMNVAIFWDIAPCSKWTDVSEERVTSIFRVEN